MMDTLANDNLYNVLFLFISYMRSK